MKSAINLTGATSQVAKLRFMCAIKNFVDVAFDELLKFNVYTWENKVTKTMRYL